MKLIDEKLGGTTPLDVILNFHNKKDDKIKKSDDDFDDWEDEDDKNSDKYWFTKKFIKVHCVAINVFERKIINSHIFCIYCAAIKKH